MAWLWKAWTMLPWVDTPSGNWSMMRSMCIAGMWAWCDWCRVHGFNTSSVFVLALLILGALSKNVSDFTKGASVIFDRFKRRNTAEVRQPTEGGSAE